MIVEQRFFVTSTVKRLRDVVCLPETVVVIVVYCKGVETHCSWQRNAEAGTGPARSP